MTPPIVDVTALNTKITALEQATNVIWSAMTSKTYASTTNIVVDAMAQNEILVTLTNDTTVLMPTNAVVDGRSIKWRFYASGGDRLVEWPKPDFRIPTSSSMTNLIVVSNETYSVFVTEYAAPTTNWLMQAYIWGYEK